jgi:hypothetical protein
MLNGQTVDPAGHVEIELPPKGSVDIPITLTIPPVIALQAQPHRFNVIATNDRGRLLGGLTLQVEVT